MGKSKITIIGSGNVGATAAHWAVIKDPLRISRAI